MYRLMRDGNIGPRLCGVLSNLFAMGDARGAVGFGSCAGYGVLCLFARGLDWRLPPRARARMGDRSPRTTFESQFTMGACREQS